VDSDRLITIADAAVMLDTTGRQSDGSSNAATSPHWFHRTPDHHRLASSSVRGKLLPFVTPVGGHKKRGA
jgi:hypothetical protein